MYNITKLSSGSQSFLTQVASMGQTMSKTAAIALARMISAEFTIPSQPVDDPEQYYRLQCEIQSNNIVSEINELTAVDAKYTLELCRNFFMLRYAMVHPQKNVFSFRADCVLEDFFGLSRAFSCETLDAIKKDGTQLAFYANGFRKIHYDIIDKCDQETAELQASRSLAEG